MRSSRSLTLAVITPMIALATIVTGLTQLSQPVQAQGLFSLFGPPRISREVVQWRHRHSPGTIVVSFSDRRLYKVLRGRRAISYPIAVPRSISRWSGTLRVSRKAVNPSWTPTPRMRRENPRLPAFVPGGHPRNPMGVRALYLGSTLYRIHGTDAPWTIGKAVSKGCIRLYNDDVVDLYRRTGVGTKVIVTWKRYRARSTSFF